jgi:uncharacterized protein YbjQ (UPF0145 family)
MIVVTTADVAGHRVVESLGLITGGEIKEYTKVLAEAREQAIDRMIEEAQALGADAIVTVRFQTSEVMTGAAEMLCYGTAVKLASSG